MQKVEEISAVILASGLSKRMKMSKAELKYDRKQNFFQKITNEYINFGCKEIIVVMNSENYNSLKSKIRISEKIKIVINKFPERGRFYSLKTGISKLNEIQYIFLQNIDNPFVNQDVLHLLDSNSKKADYIIPSYKGKGGHPILISREITNKIQNFSEENIHLKTFLNGFKKIYLDTDNKKITANINTISDYHLYF